MYDINTNITMEEPEMQLNVLENERNEIFCVLVQGFCNREQKVASAGNRTRAARVAGEHSITEPPMLLCKSERKSHSMTNKLTAR